MSRPGKVSEIEFHTLWNHFAQEGKIKADLRDRLGLTSERPLDTRRARLEAKGLEFAPFGQRNTSDSPATSSLITEAILREMIGALGPIIRGNHRKRSRNNQVDMGYATLLLGHWHQLIQLQRLIVNGSLVDYNEYAWVNNFPFGPPRQVLWITHPTHDVTFSMPVLVERRKAVREAPWVSWAA
jgi:hypothetical protein